MGAWVDAMTAARDELTRTIPAACAAGGRLVALYARAQHPYQNRTFRLETHTQYQFTEGNLSNGYRVEVHGGMPYGSFVEEGTSRSRPYPYLRPAWERNADTFAHMIEAAVVAAFERQFS